ncbi:MAG TPA: hypothetical protein VMT55_04595, partial [Candidatus Sulfotelmatobacter sp.]|nr:hypothetical protein [Candidatus Sulfotelmatobacter sp.]
MKYIDSISAGECLTFEDESAIAKAIEEACAGLGRLVFSTRRGRAALLSGYGKISKEEMLDVLLLSKPGSAMTKGEITRLYRQYRRSLAGLKNLTGQK